jgi:RecA-family ATPase
MREKLRPKDWIIEDFLLANSLTSLYGPSGSLKSFFAIDISLTIACGRSAHDCDTFLGKAIKQGKVMYLAGEGIEGIRGRVEAWQDDRKLTVPYDNFYVSRGATMVDKDSDRKRLIAMVRKCNPELLIIDTFRRNFSGNENDSKEVSEFVAAIDEIKNCCRCTVLVVAHTGKNLQTGEMGSVVWRNASDTRVRLAREDEEEQENEKNQNSIVSVIVTKQKDGNEGKFCDFMKKIWHSPDLEGYTSLTLGYCGQALF